MIRKQALQWSVGFMVMVSSVAAFGQIPTVIHYRGHLDVPGVVPAGTVQRELTFNLYEMDMGGSTIWTETQMLDIYDGNFAAVLGSVNSVTEELFTGEYRYLGVQVGADPELTPRQRIAAVPYAMRAAKSATAEVALQAENAAHADDADTVGGGQVSVSTQGVHIDPASISETVYVDGSIDATIGLYCDESVEAGEGLYCGGNVEAGGSVQADQGGTFGLSSLDTGTVFRINETDNDASPSPLDRLRVTTRRYYGMTPITQWHLVVSEDGYVGINTNNPQGTLDVNGQIFQRGEILHGDYVFDDDYELESIEEHSERMWSEKHLPEVPPRQVDGNGKEVLEIGAHRHGILVELEKAHIYIDQLNQEVKELREEIRELRKQVKD